MCISRSFLFNLFVCIAHFARADSQNIDDKAHRSKGHQHDTHSEHLLKLAIRWNCFDQATDMLEEMQYIDVPLSSSQVD